MSDWSETMRALLGKRVEVTLSAEENVKISGILHSFTDDGEVCVEEDGGSYRWGWPNLHIREA